VFTDKLSLASERSHFGHKAQMGGLLRLARSRTVEILRKRAAGHPPISYAGGRPGIKEVTKTGGSNDEIQHEFNSV
jgi:hypothetical protein